MMVLMMHVLPFLCPGWSLGQVDTCGEAQRKSLLNILHTVVEGAEFTVKETEAMYDALETALEEVENTEVTTQQTRQVKTRQR